VQTDRTIPNNKLEIIIGDNEEICVLIDVAILGDRNVVKKGAEQILKYKNLIIEIQGKWNVQTRVIPSSKRCNWNHISTIHKASDQFVSCVYFFFIDFAFHPSPQTKIGSVRANFKQPYLHTH
jgi:hypothetical protein